MIKVTGSPGISSVFFVLRGRDETQQEKEEGGDQLLGPQRSCSFLFSVYICSITTAVAFPVVPHKAVAEVSRIGHYRRGELL